MIDGGCFCGEVRYRIEDGDYPAAHCHCTMCRRTSGAPFVTWLVVPKEKFAFTAGVPKALQSSDRGRRFFCPSCGTPMTCIVDDHPDNVDVTIGSLDDPERFVPKFEIHTDTRLGWVQTDLKRD